MNFLTSLTKSAANPKSDHPETAENKSSTTDLFASAQVVAAAAQAQFSNQPESYDKGKATNAAADLLGAAEEYGKLDTTQGIGKYVDQAEGYLRQYDTAAPGELKTPPAETAAPTGDSVKEETEETVPTTTTPAATETEDTDAGEYVKKAEELVSKPSEGGDEDAGDYVKKAAEETISKLPGGADEAGDVAGEYIKKAEETFSKPSEEAGDAGDYIKKAEETISKLPGGADEAEGAGEYIKKAEEIFSKPAGGDGEKSEASEGGYGGLLKAAGGFLNK